MTGVQTCALPIWFGHLTGSRAIKRLGVALRKDCRTIDTPARYGGDEFVLILPESGEEEARKAALRICERLARDGQEPPVTVSAGLAVYPNDGTSIEKLLGAADRALYGMKHRMGSSNVKNLTRIAACLWG